MSAERKGKVYLVGAGPGDPSLLTLKGKHCLERAEVIIYDTLANERLLSYAPPEAGGIQGGKRGGEHSLPQEEINRLVIERARRGQVVVRLKGGDPFIFGRGGEEAEALHEAGVAFEVVGGGRRQLGGGGRASPPPAVIVVGEVVRLRGQLRWFEEKPLFGQRIVVTR